MHNIDPDDALRVNEQEEESINKKGNVKPIIVPPINETESAKEWGFK